MMMRMETEKNKNNPPPLLIVNRLAPPNTTHCLGSSSSTKTPSLSSSPCESSRQRLDDYLQQLKSKKKKEHNDDEDEDETEDLPEFTAEQVAQHNNSITNGNGSYYMTYDGYVYNVSDFVSLHPGGRERLFRPIFSSRGKAALEPYWYWHQQHFDSPLPLEILLNLPRVGRLRASDQDQVDQELEDLQDKLDSFRLHIEIIHTSTGGVAAAATDDKNTSVYSLEDIQSLFPKTEQSSQVGCPSSKRGVSSSMFTGVLLKDLIPILLRADSNNQSIQKIKALVFIAMDQERVELTVQHENDEKDTTSSSSSYKDILIAYEENGAPLSHQRGFPLRAIIPSKRRVVKWVQRIQVILE
jgi:cytochrome b involved in lipid metabolism